MLHNFDLVSLNVTLPEHGLVPGALGTVVEVFTQPEIAYSIEFGAQDGARMSHVMLGDAQILKHA